MIKNICVFSSSSDVLSVDYIEDSIKLGMNMGKNKYNLIFGGGTVGLMGSLARSVHKNGGKVTGVIPEYFNVKGVVYEESDELIVTKDMRERKDVMEKKSDAFIALPGGFGTLEELLEIITLKQVNVINKPIVIINTNNFFKHLLSMFGHIFKERFAKPEFENLYFVAQNAESALSYIETYKSSELVKKWF